jgi:formate/nitrite transporter FocA (FNT family)
MTLLSMANMLPHGAGVSWSGMAYNLSIVTLGNVVSGAIMMGVAYWFVTDAEETVEVGTPAPTSNAVPEGDD